MELRVHSSCFKALFKIILQHATLNEDVKMAFFATSSFLAELNISSTHGFVAF